MSTSSFSTPELRRHSSIPYEPSQAHSAAARTTHLAALPGIFTQSHGTLGGSSSLVRSPPWTTIAVASSVCATAAWGAPRR